MEPGGAASGLPAVTVVAAFHRPSWSMVQAQIASLLRQTGVRLRLVGVIDGAETAQDHGLMALLAEAGFDVLINAENQGAVATFARGLEYALETAAEGECFAYCDQDDVWHDSKLAKSAAHLAASAAHLVYCDARVIDDAGEIVASSLHDFESRQEPEDLLQHLLLNAVTGMTALFTRDTAELALRLLRATSTSFLHDHVTAIAAASLGTTARLAEPLVDYVQHGENQLGARPHNPAWRRRSLGVFHLWAYRATSSAMFDERRTIASALDREGRLPANIATMFLVRRPGFFRFEVTYIAAIRRLITQRQYRRAMLCLRMMDAAFSRWLRGI